MGNRKDGLESIDAAASKTALAALDEALDRYRPADHRTWDQRDVALAQMRALSIAEYRGTTRQLLRRERRYAQRVFTRRAITLHADTDRDEPFAEPALSDIRYSLTSLDELRCFVIRVIPSSPYRRYSKRKSRSETVIRDPPKKPTPSMVEAWLLRRDDAELPYEWLRPLPWANAYFDPVWFHTGAPNLWPIAQRIWSEGILRRPLRPLTPEAVLVRARAHEGGLVKVVTPTGAHVGYCRPDYERGDQAVRQLQELFLAAEPHSRKGRWLPKAPILEIVPWQWQV